MAYSPITDLNLGSLLQIVFSDGVRNQISEDYRDWDAVMRHRYGNSAAREMKFMFQSGYGPSAIQYAQPGKSGRAFPRAQQSTINEYTAKFKEINATIELEYNLWDRARKSPEKYAEPLAIEIMSKTTASKRRLAADYYGAGLGIIGTLASSALEAGQLRVTLDASNAANGHVGFFEFDDILVLRSDAETVSGVANASSDVYTYSAGGPVVYWRVVDKERDNESVLLEALDANYDSLILSAITVPATAGDFFLRSGQPTKRAPSAFSGDFGQATEVIAGLESLVAADARVIHGITMQGSSKGTRVGANGQPLDVSYIQKALDKVKVAVGADKYRWKYMCMAPEAHAALIESRESDRRFQTIQDNARGINYFAYQHGNDSVETITSEYCPKKRLYIKPEAKSSEKVFEYWGSDFETVKAQGMADFHLKPSAGGGYENTITSFLQAIGVLVCKHPASVATLEDFTL